MLKRILIPIAPDAREEARATICGRSLYQSEPGLPTLTEARLTAMPTTSLLHSS